LLSVARDGLRHYRWNLRFEGAEWALMRVRQGETPTAASVAETLERRDK
jgi:hypothetical protein